jgi:tRNA-Thr(GGU) m(6)t(6)A37 methyltransferase TsaA
MEILEEYAEAMANMEVGKSYEVLFWFDKINEVKLTVPYRGVGPMMGIFSTHAPYRPNPIGASIIKVTKIEGRRIHFTGVDMMDGTPVLDIKSAN